MNLNLVYTKKTRDVNLLVCTFFPSTNIVMNVYTTIERYRKVRDCSMPVPVSILFETVHVLPLPISLSEDDDIIQVTTGSIGLKYNMLSVC